VAPGGNIASFLVLRRRLRMSSPPSLSAAARGRLRPFIF
jgi:hypothetical protein